MASPVQRPVIASSACSGAYETSSQAPYTTSPSGTDGPNVANQSPGVVSVVSRRDEEDESRFVGDLNPEGEFLSATSPETPAAGSSTNNVVGIWHSRSAASTIAKSNHLKDPSKSHSNLYQRSAPQMSNLLLPLLEEQCLKLLPRPDSIEFLTRIYLLDIHPIFPVLDARSFKQMIDGTAAKIILTQTLCLAASTNCKDLSQLNLVGAISPPLNRKAFIQQLYTAIQTSLHLGLVKDKLVLTQVLSILSMYTQFSDDRHSSAELCG
jgi:hypothetical protein